MKLTKLSLLSLSCAAAFAFAGPVFAQDSDSKPQTTKKMDRPHGGKMRDMANAVEKLPKELQERFKAAAEKAKNDPDVVAAREKVREADKAAKDAFNTALRKADSEVADAWEKITSKKGAKKD